MSTSLRVSINGKGVLLGTTILDKTTGISKCYRFSKVPYALPPTGMRRWQKPFPLPPNYSYGSEENPGLFKHPSIPCPQASLPPESSNEDCLQCNIYVPIGTPPNDGWPVFFQIHGGFLQFGSNNTDDPSSLISETDVKCIVVSPGYRLGVFGFLASRELWEHASDSGPVANAGFWDQRQALEWTYDNIESFGGNKNNITVGGLSAGSYSTFHQLAHDIGPNAKKQIIRRVIQWSNGCGVEPKRLAEAQEQFDDLTSILKVPRHLSGPETIKILRAKSAPELISAVARMKQKFIRPVLDGEFISENLFQSIYDGTFGLRMKELGIQTIIGDLTQEFQIYKKIFPPTSYESLVERLAWDYPRNIAMAVCERFNPRTNSFIQQPSKDFWIEIFGKLYADLQIHSTMRGFIKEIHKQLPLSSIHRYSIDWRTESTNRQVPKELGATHGTDMSIWFFGNGGHLTQEEKILVREWLKPMSAFIKGENVTWGTRSINEVRYLNTNGIIEYRKDEVMEEKLELWELTKEVTKSQKPKRKSKI